MIWPVEESISKEAVVSAPERVGECAGSGVGGGNGAADVLVRAGVLVDLPGERVGDEGHIVVDEGLIDRAADGDANRSVSAAILPAACVVPLE